MLLVWGSGQVAKMITAEAVTYAICGTAAGIILGLLLHYLIYAKIVITHFGGSWNISFATICNLYFYLVVFSCIVAIYDSSKTYSQYGNYGNNQRIMMHSW